MMEQSNNTTFQLHLMETMENHIAKIGELCAVINSSVEVQKLRISRIEKKQEKDDIILERKLQLIEEDISKINRIKWLMLALSFALGAASSNMEMLKALIAFFI